MIYLHSNLPHKCPIIHKDLKPANIIISNQGVLKIIDLGISGLTKLQDAIGRIKTSILNKRGGTFLYQAPEHFNSSKEYEVTLACDVWSFALVVGEILSGKLPTGYYAWVKGQTISGRHFPYPVGDQVTILRFFLWKCLKVKFSERLTFNQLKDEF